MTSPTISALQSQWRNPNDVLSVLLIIGGEIVRTALAQTSGGFFTPVCFSFGWVSYSFTALVNVIGEGRLLPPPDYPVKVFNLDSGYYRENKNWVIGRLLRDNEARVSNVYPLLDNGLRISIYDALPNGTPNRFRFFAPGSFSITATAVIVMLVQLVVAAIPFILHKEWAIFLITVAGTFLAVITGVLPQWKAERLPTRQETWKNMALTSGNGARDIMVIIGGGKCLDLEELCAAETPRSPGPWEKFTQFSREVRTATTFWNEQGDKFARRAVLWSKFPAGFWLTRYVCGLQSLCWLALLVTVAGLKQDTWYLLAVGGIGMFQNAVVAAIDRSSETRDIPLQLKECIRTKKVMDGLMDLEDAYRDRGDFGSHLVRELFPGPLREDEIAWWKGDRDNYEKARFEDKLMRGVPRGVVPNYHITGERSQAFANAKNPTKDPGGKRVHGNRVNEIPENRSSKTPPVVGGPSKRTPESEDREKDSDKETNPDEPTHNVASTSTPDRPLDMDEVSQPRSARIDWASDGRPTSAALKRAHFGGVLNEGIFDSPRASMLGDEPVPQDLETSDSATNYQVISMKSKVNRGNMREVEQRRMSSTRSYPKIGSPDWA